MISFKIAGITLHIDFTFFAVIALFLILDTTGYGLLSILACFCHEMAHLIAMLCYKEKPQDVVLYAGSIRINGMPVLEEHFAVIIAGCCANIGIFLAVYLFMDRTDIYPLMFAVTNFAIGCFNLLPMGCLDGRKILSYFTIKCFPPVIAISIEQIVERITISCTLLVVLLLFFNNIINFTAMVVLGYIVFATYIEK